MIRGTIKATIEPLPNRPADEGYGEGVHYPTDKVRSRAYYYRVGKLIPKNKVVALKWEGNYCGRCTGDTEFVILAWNGVDFSVLDLVQGGEVKKVLAKYKGQTPAEAIKAAEEEEQKHQEWVDQLPKCSICKKTA